MKAPFYFLLPMFLLLAAPTQADIAWNYWSPLNVAETITDLGDGTYRYEYSFTNVDSSPIWTFGVYTQFEAIPEHGFHGHTLWSGPHYISIFDAFPEKDARNLDPDIVGYIATSSEAGYSGNPADSILLAESAFGYSFIAPVHDVSPKYYYYCTIESGSPDINGTGTVAAVGNTVPEPTTFLFFSLALPLANIRRRGQQTPVA